MSLISNLWSRFTGTKAIRGDEAQAMAAQLIRKLEPPLLRAKTDPLSKTVISSFQIPTGGSDELHVFAKVFCRDLIAHYGWMNLAILQEEEFHELTFVVNHKLLKPEDVETIWLLTEGVLYLGSNEAFYNRLPTFTRRYQNADGSEEQYVLRCVYPSRVTPLTDVGENVSITLRFQGSYEVTKEPVQ